MKIALCICTYKRPDLLEQLLRSLQTSTAGETGVISIAAALETSFERRAIPGTARPVAGVPTAPRE